MLFEIIQMKENVAWNRVVAVVTVVVKSSHILDIFWRIGWQKLLMDWNMEYEREQDIKDYSNANLRN